MMSAADGDSTASVTSACQWEQWFKKNCYWTAFFSKLYKVIYMNLVRCWQEIEEILIIWDTTVLRTTTICVRGSESCQSPTGRCFSVNCSSVCDTLQGGHIFLYHTTHTKPNCTTIHTRRIEINARWQINVVFLKPSRCLWIDATSNNTRVCFYAWKCLCEGNAVKSWHLV